MKHDLTWWFGIDLAFQGCGFKKPWGTQIELHFWLFWLWIGIWRVKGKL